MKAAMSSIKSLRRFALPLALAAGLAACTSPSFKADVSRFAVPLPAPQGQTFAVVPEDPKLAGGLEFATYANSVAEEMTQLGYTRAASPEAADMLVRFDYRVDNGRERVRTDLNGAGFAGNPWGPWGGWGGGFGRWGYGFNDPFFGGPNVRSFTVYTRSIAPLMASACSKARPKRSRARTACPRWCPIWSTRSSPTSPAIRARPCGSPSATTKKPCAPPIDGVERTQRDPWTGKERRRQGIGAAFFCASAIVQLRSDRCQPFPRDAIGLPRLTAD